MEAVYIPRSRIREMSLIPKIIRGFCYKKKAIPCLIIVVKMTLVTCFFNITFKSFIIIIIISSSLFAQQPDSNDYIAYYEKGEYQKALMMLKQQLNKIYQKRVEEKRAPLDIITIKKLEEGIDINGLFKKRKARGFFIEENDVLYNLHLFTARCNFNLARFDSSLNHYYQALRFKTIEFGKDDAIFYEISKVYKKWNHFEAYIRSLESAYTLNPNNYQYSLELGKALHKTSKKNKIKKAIYHLERYIQTTDDEPGNHELYLMIGNLNEEIGRYIETVKYYQKYLKKRSDDGYVYFALGYLAYKRVGNFALAINCFNRSLELLPVKELYRRSKANEYKGDMFMKELEFDKAAGFYHKTIKYQEKIKLEMDDRSQDLLVINEEINKIKSSLIIEKDYDKYDKYENLREKKGKIEIKKREKEYEFKKLNAGKVRWNLAQIYEKMEKLDNAIKYYRETISFNYNSTLARKKILKLKLKIKRGY